MTEEQFRELKAQVDEAKAKSDRAQGVFTAIMDRLKEQFGCKTIGDARKILAELREKKDKSEKAFNKALKEYERKWKPND